MPRRRFWSVFPASAREATDAIVANLLLHAFPARMRVTSLAWTPSLWLGTVSWVLFVSLLVTGLPLMVFYIPSTREAYQSIKDIEHVVSFGWWLRAAHRIAAHAMVDRRHAPPRPRLPHRIVPERRRARAAPRVELGDRRGAAGGDRPAVVHRLPAAVGPAGLLGGHDQHEHRGVRAARRPGPARAAARRRRGRAGGADALLRAAHRRAADRGRRAVRVPHVADSEGRRPGSPGRGAGGRRRAGRRTRSRPSSSVWPSSPSPRGWRSPCSPS